MPTAPAKPRAVSPCRNAALRSSPASASAQPKAHAGCHRAINLRQHDLWFGWWRSVVDRYAGALWSRVKSSVGVRLDRGSSRYQMHEPIALVVQVAQERGHHSCRPRLRIVQQNDSLFGDFELLDHLLQLLRRGHVFPIGRPKIGAKDKDAT